MNSTQVDSLIGAGCLLFGLVCLLVGYRLLRILSGVIGFVVSGTVGYVVVYYFISPTIVPSAVVGSILGAVGGILFSFYLPAGIFAMGSFLGFCFSLFVISLSQAVKSMNEDDSREVVLIFLSLAGGLLALRFRKPAVVECTSLVGAYGIVSGVDAWIGSGFSSLYNSILDCQLTATHFSGLLVGAIVAWVAISAMGVVLQYRLTARDVVLEGKGLRASPFFGRKTVKDDSVPLLEVITYYEDDGYLL